MLSTAVHVPDFTVRSAMEIIMYGLRAEIIEIIFLVLLSSKKFSQGILHADKFERYVRN